MRVRDILFLVLLLLPLVYLALTSYSTTVVEVNIPSSCAITDSNFAAKSAFYFNSLARVYFATVVDSNSPEFNNYEYDFNGCPTQVAVSKFYAGGPFRPWYVETNTVLFFNNVYTTGYYDVNGYHYWPHVTYIGYSSDGSIIADRDLGYLYRFESNGPVFFMHVAHNFVDSVGHGYVLDLRDLNRVYVAYFDRSDNNFIIHVAVYEYPDLNNPVTYVDLNYDLEKVDNDDGLFILDDRPYVCVVYASTHSEQVGYWQLYYDPSEKRFTYLHHFIANFSPIEYSDDYSTPLFATPTELYYVGRDVNGAYLGLLDCNNVNKILYRIPYEFDLTVSGLMFGGNVSGTHFYVRVNNNTFLDIRAMASSGSGGAPAGGGTSSGGGASSVSASPEANVPSQSSLSVSPQKSNRGTWLVFGVLAVFIVYKLIVNRKP